MARVALRGTSTLLLRRLVACPEDGEAWREFTQRYGGIIYGWCRSHHLQDADARDITQNVFAALLRTLSDFDSKRGRFRTWLFRIVENSLKDWCKKPAQRLQTGTPSVWHALASEEDRRDLEARLSDEFDLELLGLAEQNVRLHVAPQSWESYRLRCKEGLSLRDVAQRIGIPAGHVSKYALRVRDMVAQNVACLEEQCNAEVRCDVGDKNERVPAPQTLAQYALDCLGELENRTLADHVETCRGVIPDTKDSDGVSK